MKVPEIVYATFAGMIDQQSLPRLFNSLTIATQNSVKEVHLLFQSTGGIIPDGISLYNFFHSFPIDLHIYNTGSVQSVAVLPFIAAKHTYVSAQGTFTPLCSSLTKPSVAPRLGVTHV